ncbi:MAG TPA: PAS domain S-box protein, partial [Pirellulales bacterium]|nr:PAS domain S-box protein [Pirellulales bacterium]
MNRAFDEPRSIEEAEAILLRMSRSIAQPLAELSKVAALEQATDDEAMLSPAASAPPPQSWSEKTFRSLIEAGPDAIVIIDQQGLIALVNAQTERLFGYDRSELIGQPIERLVPIRYRRDHVARRNRYIEQPEVRPMGRNLDLLGLRKDGREFPVEISLSPLRTETGLIVTATVRDITDRKRLEAKYRSLVENIPAVTFMAALDEGNNEFYVSPQIETLLGFSQQEWLGDPFLWYRQLHPDDRQRWGEEFARTCASGVNFSSEYRFRSRDGRDVWVHGEARVARDDQGRPLFLQGIAFDITESKQAEQALRRSAEELEHKVGERTVELQDATLRAEAASHARASFLANMSHEIRTPLNSIIGFADLLRRGAETSEEERLDWLATIYGGGRHLLALINDILDLSKIDAGKLDVEQVPCSPVKIIQEVCAILKSKASEKGLLITAAFDGLMPATIISDPTRLRQVLMNVAGNAIKFTTRGSVQVRARLDRRDDRSPKLVIRVIDTGIGIPADKMETIFDPFTQADSSITRQYGGTGLGLAISRRLAASLGGSISVRSAVGEGTVFTIEIATGPLDQVPMWDSVDEQTHVDSGPLPTPTMPVLDHDILVVDDTDTNRKLIRLTLGRTGARISEARNGQEAVDQVLAKPFHLVLMDMQMPVMDGYTATQRLRASGVTIPIVAVTANAMKGDEARCRAAGCTGYLPKPVDQDQLLLTVASLLGVATNRGQPSVTDDRPRPTAAETKLRSKLPIEHAEFREILVEFVEQLSAQLAEMRQAVQRNDFRSLAALAHRLKGTAGSVGFPDFTEPAAL